MSKRTNSIEESGIRKIFDKAASIKNVVNLSIGQPDFPVNDAVKEGIIKAIRENKTGYTPSGGIAELRQKILAKYKLENSKEMSSIVTVGTSGAIFLAYSTLLDEGDEMIIFDPYFVMYPTICRFLGAKSIIVKTNGDYSINFAALEKAITKKTKAIMLNSPCNPSGYVCTSDEIKKLCAIAKKHDLWIISDEVYEHFDYEKRFVSVAGYHKKAVILGGFSKNFALTGLRCGYAVAPLDVINDMVKLQQFTFVCAPSAVQHAVCENFEYDISKQIEMFKKRRDFVYESLRRHYAVVKPTGAFYFLIKLPANISGTKFSDLCLKKGLLVVPGESFGLKDDCFRISYAVSDEVLKKGVEILVEIAKEIPL